MKGVEGGDGVVGDVDGECLFGDFFLRGGIVSTWLINWRSGAVVQRSGCAV